ncbi:ABC transporter permease [Cohnella cellulosilytica]|uniref:ABC transporter permease n=1 Tax=Cohnella cellulosilytica TaxID=986710 RepID=A0ABW2F5T4_9BACL
MPRGTFFFLVKHELASKGGKLRLGKWLWIYGGLLLLLAGAAVAIWGRQADYDPSYFMFTAYIFPFMAFGLAVESLKREWSGGTIGWWLSLPHSRARLLGAKAAAVWIRFAGYVLIYFAVVLLLDAYSVAMFGDRITSIKGMLVLEAQLFGILLGISPAMLALGLLLVSVRRSGLKPLLPLLWLLMGIGGNLLGWMTGGGQLTMGGADDDLFALVYPSWIWLSMIPIWAVAALLFAGAVKVCDKHLEL